MWETKVKILDNDILQFTILGNNIPLTFRNWTTLVNTSEDFILFFTDTLNKSNFSAFFWEVKPVSIMTWDTPFEFVLINSNLLSKKNADIRSFDEYLNINESIVSFKNLRGDASLVVPNQLKEKACYAHLAIFLRDAPEQQIIDLWKKVANEFESKINDKPIWLNTAGLGVPWLHIRIDTRPKYYKFQRYKSIEG